MKRILILLLTLCLLLSVLSACKGNNGDDTAATTDPSQSGESESESGGDEDDYPELNIIDDKYRNWYEIFVYSFFDTNNDGIGDLKGVISKLDYIKDMGFNGIWLMPIHPSPTYHKYDVSDYYAIDPVYGTTDDLHELVEKAHEKGIKVIMDLVVNHTAVNHPWFKEACNYMRDNGEIGGPYGDYYNFHEGPLSGYHSVSGTNFTYEGRFWSGMPDLNLDSEGVRAEIVSIMNYWMTFHGVDGFRLDAVTSYYTGNVDKNVEFLRWLGEEARAINPDCYIVGEAWEGSDYQINRYYESGIDSFFLFTGAQATGTIASAVKQQNGKAVAKLMTDLQSTYTKGVLAPFLGNHDTMRPGSFMPGEENLKMAAGVMCMMNGSIFVYYGEEIGMISKGGNNSDPAKRIAMKWSDKRVYEGWCYISPENTPVDETSYYYPSVETQLADETSILNYYKNAIRLRNTYPAISRGVVEDFSDGQVNYISVIRKTYEGESVTILMNLDTFEQTFTVDKAALGYEAIVGVLYASEEGELLWDGEGTFTLPPQSIIILK